MKKLDLNFSKNISLFQVIFYFLGFFVKKSQKIKDLSINVSSRGNLETHQKNTLYCIEKRGLVISEKNQVSRKYRWIFKVILYLKICKILTFSTFSKIIFRKSLIFLKN